MIGNTQQLIDEFQIKATASGLSVDCPADGLFASEIVIVAEAPGEREVQVKSPLVGGSGSLLWNILRKHGINRNDCFITNVAKRQVAFDVDERRQSLGKHEFELWAELLRWELSQLPNARLIVCLGNFALKALTGHDGITSWRGSVIPVTIAARQQQHPRTCSLVASYNPAAVLRSPKYEPIFNMDMGRVKRVLEGKWKPHKITPIINPSMSDARGFIADLRKDGGAVAYDIETMGGETACVGFANNAYSGMCINFRNRTEHRFSLEDELLLRHDIQDLLLDPNIKLIAQNNMFDSSWLWFKDKIKVQPIWMDTMLAHHTLYPMMPHNLGFICTQYTTHPYYKDEKDAWRERGNIDEFWEYNVKDCCITWEASHKMNNELSKQSLSQFFFDHVMRLQHHLVRMVVGGVLIDVQLKEKIKIELLELLGTYKANFNSAVHEATGDVDYFPNPLSPTQLSDLLFTRLRLVGRGASTNSENRQRMYKDHRTSQQARNVLETLDKYKEEQKFFSTYVDTAIDTDNRMRCEYKQTGVQKAPGRLSSSKVLWGHYDIRSKQIIQHGMNLQNQPKRAYDMFIADEGYTFIYFDLSQAEARYVGWDAEIPEWIEQFEKARLDGKYDAHRALASTMFNIPYDDVPTADEENGVKTIRYIAKRCRHGLNYRMMPDRLATTTGLSINEAQRAFELYHRTNPQLRRSWWPRLEKEAKESRMLFNSYGRRLFIQGRLDDPETLESVVAFRPQSTIGDKVSRVIYLSEDDDKWPHDARVALNIHDAIIGLAPIEKAKSCLSILKKYAEEPIIVKPSMSPLIIPADCGIAEPDDAGIRRWSTIKKIKDIEAAK